MTIVEPILTFFFYAIVAIAAQNAIFTRALGVSRLVKIVDDGSVELFKFGALLTAVQLISSLLSFFAGRALMGLALPYKSAFLPLVLVLCSAIAFFIVLLILVLPKKRALAKDYVTLLPMAEVEGLCDRIAILHHGELVFCGAVAELTAHTGGSTIVSLQTAKGRETFAAADLTAALLAKLTELQRKQIAVLDIQTNRRTLEECFINIAKGAGR